MKSTLPLALSIALASTLAGCSKTDSTEVVEATPEPPAETVMATDPVESNPFFTESPLYLHYPQFDKIGNSHYTPAFEKGMQEQLAEIEAIANQSEAPTLDNTLIPMERSGQTLDRVARVFFAMASANTNDELEEIRSEMAPKLSAHRDQILLNAKLFERVQALYDQRDSLELDPESYRLVEENYKDFIRAGAKLSDADKEKLKAINAEMASLQTKFSQNVLNEVNDSAVVVDSREELAGMSDTLIEAAAEAANEKGLEGKYVIALLNTTQQPPLASLEDRALRQRIMEASMARGSRGGEFDNREILTRVVELRAERAQLMGYENHAAYGLENQTARTTKAVNERLASLAPPAVANAKREAADMQKIIDAEGGNFELASWDWDFYAEKVRMERYNFDASQLRPYFEMNNVLEKGVFFAAEKVFGITFKERKDLPVYQEDVRVFEVFEADGSTLALFIMDPYARPSKRGGAWMNAYVSQSNLMGNKPVVANHQNITKPTSDDEPTLLTFDEVTTMFHEFGHALHGMFSNVKYPSFSGTSVPRDFVEYPSQVNEMWSVWPDILKNYAVHYETGEAMPQELLDKVLATRKFNQGYTTTEYLAASLLDQAWHQLKPEEVPTAEGLLDFEAQALENAGVALDTVPPRYRSTYFSHIIGGYSAGYYAYIWSEVLDADTVEWFKQNGGMTRENGDHFRQTLLSRGGAVDAMDLFRNFRGADPDIQPLLDRRGLN
ncbi:MAG: M3 family metallopeptidase [Gammaproteobacteria bacterium]|nr:M3 family metallopeptidase [Gammaproteobacteria bacterium]NNK98975.1 M3 family metallopeptidase [Xanthomonadales bacterium]